MSTAIARTHNTMGVRRQLGAIRQGRQLGGIRQGRQLQGLGAADPDLVAAMIQAGYDPGTINTLVVMGATDAQLENLFLDGGDPATLMNQLGGALPAAGGNAAQAGSFPQSAVPTTVSSAWGVYDLTQEASWTQITSILSGIKNELQSVALKFPGDADTAGQIQNFNSTVMQYAGYYEKLFGSAPSPIPLASTTGLGALGIFPIVVVGAMVVAIAAILAAAYSYHQWAQVKLAQTSAPAQTATAQAQSTQAQNQSALVAQYQAAVAAGNTTLANSLLPTITALGINPSATTNWTTWFQNNMVLLLAGAAAIVVLPQLAKKL